MTEIKSDYVNVEGLRVHYLSAGQGAPVLLIHGFPTSSHLWRNVLPRLAERHRAIAIDLPGYGLSDKPLDVTYNFYFFEKILEGFVEALGLEDVSLVVHDIGGPIGLFWAVRRPQHLSSLVILNTLVYPQTSWAVKMFVVAMRLPGVRGFIVSEAGVIAAMRLGVVHKGRLDPEAVAPYTSPFATRPARQALIKAASGLSVRGLKEVARRLPKLSIPVRIIYGERDRLLPHVAKTVRRLKADLPQAEVTALPDCGHFLQEDDPALVARMIDEFLVDAEARRQNE